MVAVLRQVSDFPQKQKNKIPNCSAHPVCSSWTTYIYLYIKKGTHFRHFPSIKTIKKPNLYKYRHPCSRSQTPPPPLKDPHSRYSTFAVLYMYIIKSELKWFTPPDELQSEDGPEEFFPICSRVYF